MVFGFGQDDDNAPAGSTETADLVKQGYYAEALEAGIPRECAELKRWAKENRINRKALKQLVKLQRQIEKPGDEIDQHRSSFKDRVWKVMKWVGIGTLVAGSAGTAWAAKQAWDVREEVMAGTVGRELKERMDAVEKYSDKLQEKLLAFASRLTSYMEKWAQKLTDAQNIKGMMENIAVGIGVDTKEFLEDGDTKFDKTFGTINAQIHVFFNDPVMITEWALVKKDFDEIKAMRAEFTTLRKEVTNLTGDDQHQMLKDFDKAFWKEVRKEISGIPLIGRLVEKKK